MQSLIPDADPLHKVSIIPRGPMGGATFALPEKDRTLFTRRYCIALLQVCFGGRIAEEMFCDDISSGAQSDIEQATRIARQMVLTWGMSDQLGPVSYGPDQGVKEAAYIMPTEREYSEKTAENIDAEVRRIMDEAYKKAKLVIEENRDKLEGHRPGPAQVRDARRRRRQAHPGRRAFGQAHGGRSAGGRTGQDMQSDGEKQQAGAVGRLIVLPGAGFLM